MKRTLLSTLILTCSFYAMSASAMNTSAPIKSTTDKTGFYVGGEFGHLKAKVKSELGSSTEGTTHFGAYGGYNFTSWFGLEATAYGRKGVKVPGGEKYNIGVLAVTPKFTYWLNDRLAVYAKVGIADVGIDFKNNLKDEEYGDNDYWGFGETAGVGVNYAVTQNLNLRLAYDYVHADISNDYWFGPDSELKTTLSKASFGVNYQF